MPEFTKEYFIAKFEAILADQIGRGSINKFCALWHCGVRSDAFGYIPTDESHALAELLRPLFSGDAQATISDSEIVYSINDDNVCCPKEYSEAKFPTAKDRLHAALRDLP